MHLELLHVTEDIGPRNVENMMNAVLNMIIDMQDDEARVPDKTSNHANVQFENEEIPSR